MTSKANDKPQPKGKEKRPWSKPQIKLIDVNFTFAGFNVDLDRHEGLPTPGAQTGATYRTS